jgi:hypothetical protein
MENLKTNLTINQKLLEPLKMRSINEICPTKNWQMQKVS